MGIRLIYLLENKLLYKKYQLDLTVINSLPLQAFFFKHHHSSNYCKKNVIIFMGIARSNHQCLNVVFLSNQNMAHCGLDNWNFSYSFFYEKLKMSKNLPARNWQFTNWQLSVNICQRVFLMNCWLTRRCPFFSNLLCSK